MNKNSLLFRIFCGIVIGSILALLFPDLGVVVLLGELFVGALKSIAPILVAILVTYSIAKARPGLGSKFRVVILLYLITTLLAATFAVFASRLFPVDIVLANMPSDVSSGPNELKEVFMNMLKGIMINPITAIMNANYLSILLWAITLGLALKKIANDKTIAVLKDWSDAISKLVSWIIQLAPIGILGLVYSSVSDNGLEIFSIYGKLLLLLVGCMLIVTLVINPAIIAFMLKANPYPLVFACLKGSGISAFFTRSSAANIPVNMDLCKRMGVEEDFYSVSIPLGSTINMDGAAITITIMTLATCNTLGMEVSFGSALILSFVATLAACGSSGIAGGSLLLIPLACSLFGIGNDIAMQVVAVGFIISVVQDSVETALNSSGDAMFTIAAEMYEKKKNNI